MNHTTLIQSLRSTVRKHEATYQRARERTQGLETYATGVALFDALSPESELGSEARQALLRVVVLDYKVARHPMWHALAACALRPMLAGLRTRRAGTSSTRDDQGGSRRSMRRSSRDWVGCVSIATRRCFLS